MNPNIILAGQSPEIMNALSSGYDLGQRVNDARYQQQYRNALSEYGAGAMAGDPRAQAALAGFDPAAVQGMQTNALNMDVARQNMAVQREQMQAAREQSRQQAQQAAAQMSAEQAAAARRQLGNVLGALMSAPDEATYNRLAQSAGINPTQYTFADREFNAAMVMGTMDALELRTQQAELSAGPELPAAAQSLEWRAQQAGLQPGTPEYQSFMANGGLPRNNGFRVETLPDGRTIVTQGELGQVDEGRMDPTSTSAMIASIDGILNDPALDTATGIGSIMQRVPGTGAYRFGTRARQLEGQAFLQAFESLKGAGQITEIEGAKATQAIGRLDTGQSSQDYRDALTELREILVAAQSRPPGWAATQEASQAPAGASSGTITPQVIQSMTPTQLAQFMQSVDLTALPDEVLSAIIARGEE